MNVSEIDSLSIRGGASDPEIDPRFAARWSPRAFAEDRLTAAQMASLAEAARWAPSCFNAQPWRFAYALRPSAGFDALLATLVEANQVWAHRAGALIAVASRTRYERNDQPAPTHSFDAGAAWMSLALQAQSMGLITHGMQGFDADAARAVLALPEPFDLPVLIAVGLPGAVGDLPEGLQEREAPSGRKDLREILFTDNFREMSA